MQPPEKARVRNHPHIPSLEHRRPLSSSWIGTTLPMLTLTVALVGLARSAAFAGPSTTVSGPSASAASSTLRVLIRVDIGAAEKHLRMAELMRSVQAIWRPYAVIVFLDTADPGRTGYDDEIQLVVSARVGSSATGAPSLGWMTFVAPGQPASFVTVSIASARNLIAGSSWMGRPFERLPLTLSQQFVTRAVSWSAAHEIGHYLLRTSRHSKSGLMRSRLTAPEVLRNEKRLIQLERQEVEVLRLRATRAGAAPKPLLEPPVEAP